MVEVIISPYVGGSANELLQLISFLARTRLTFLHRNRSLGLASAQSSPWSLLAFLTRPWTFFLLPLAQNQAS